MTSIAGLQHKTKWTKEHECRKKQTLEQEAVVPLGNSKEKQKEKKLRIGANTCFCLSSLCTTVVLSPFLLADSLNLVIPVPNLSFASMPERSISFSASRSPVLGLRT